MRGIGDLDGEIRLSVAVDVPLDDLSGRAPISPELADNAVEIDIGANEGKSVIGIGSIRHVGVDAGKVDDVPGFKILD